MDFAYLFWVWEKVKQKISKQVIYWVNFVPSICKKMKENIQNKASPGSYFIKAVKNYESES